MKKIVYAILGALALTGCSEEDLFDRTACLNIESMPVIEAGMETQHDETRASLGQDNYINWTYGDCISVFAQSTANNMYELKSGQGTTKGVFKAKTATAGAALDYYAAAYPYRSEGGNSVKAVIGGVEFNTEFPAMQTYKANSFDNLAHRMVAVSDKPKLQFKNVGGALCLNLKGDKKINKISIEGYHNEPIAGKGSCQLTTNGTPTVWVPAEGAAQVVTLDCSREGGVQLNASTPTPFYIVLPPVVFEGGFTIRIEDTEGKLMTKSTIKKQEIQRNGITNMPEFNYVPREATRAKLASSSDFRNVIVRDLKLQKSSGETVDGNSWYIDITKTTFEVNSSRSKEGAFKVSDASSTIPIYIIQDAANEREVIIFTEADVIDFNESSVQMFLNYINMTEIVNLDKCFTDNVTNMSNMFKNCELLTNLDITHFKTDNATDISYMFGGCRSVKQLDISHFKTTNVTKMDGLFAKCYELESIDISHFDISKLISLDEVFAYDKALVNLTLPENFINSKIISIKGLFMNCKSLTSLDLSKFDTSNISYMNNAFGGASSLTTLNLPANFVTRNTSYLEGLFVGCKGLTNIDMSGWDTSDVKSMQSLFAGCSSMSTIDISSFNTTLTYNMTTMFSGCTNLTNIITGPNFDTSQVRYFNGMFSNCSSMTDKALENILGKMKTDAAETLFGMFSGCTSLTNFTVPASFDTKTVTRTDAMFKGCTNLKTLDISSLNTSKVIYAFEMFSGCTSLNSITFGENFKFDSMEKCDQMFMNCKSLKSIDFGKATGNKLISIAGMFSGCESITHIAFNIGGEKLIGVEKAFYNCYKLTDIDVRFLLSKEDPSLKRVRLDSCFENCYSLSKLDLGGWWMNLRIQSMTRMFANIGKNVNNLEVIMPGFTTDFTHNWPNGKLDHIITKTTGTFQNARIDKLRVITTIGAVTLDGEDFPVEDTTFKGAKINKLAINPKTFKRIMASKNPPTNFAGGKTEFMDAFGH